MTTQDTAPIRAERTVELTGQDGQDRLTLGQFHDVLRVRMLEIDPASPPFGPRQQVLYDEMRAVLDQPTEALTWRQVQMAEVLLAYLQPEPTLDIGLQRSLGVLAGMRPAHKVRFQSLYDAILAQEKAVLQGDGQGAVPSARGFADAIVVQKRTLLAHVLEEMNWAYVQRQYNRARLEWYTRRATWFGIAIAVIFVLSLTMIGLDMLGWVRPGEAGSATGTATGIRWDYTALELAITAGLVGASFSILTRQMPGAEEVSMAEMRHMTSLSVFFLRLTIGAIGAVILYFFFEAGVLSGTLLPDLGKVGFVKITGDGGHVWAGRFVPNPDLSKLLVWSFVAGFFEKFVSGLLNQVKDRTEKGETVPPVK